MATLSKPCGFIIALCLLGCTSSEPKTETVAKEAEKVAEEKNEGFNKLDLENLANAVNKAELVPSPVEMEQKLKEAGLQSELGSQIPAGKSMEVVVADHDQTAIRTGVVMADLVLTLKTSDQATILDRLGKMKAGLQKLGAGQDIYATIEDFETKVSDNSINKADLLSEFDDLSQVMVSELEYEAGEWVVPLIQSGTWLEGANLVSKVMIKEGKYDQANTFFRQKEIVEYFISYVDREGKDRAPDKVIGNLVDTLNQLKVIASKPNIEEADVKKIEELSSVVLGLL